MKRLAILLMCALCLFCGFKRSTTQKKTNDIMLVSRESGLFSLYFDVLALLRGYENHSFDSVYVNFGTNGLYYDKTVGPNWWEYYFLPVKYGEQPKHVGQFKFTPGNSALINTKSTEATLSRQEANFLINKYIKIQPSLLVEIDQFAYYNFNEYIIGVHYRGTDKWCEAPRVKYQDVLDAIDREILFVEGNYKIFVATDEEAFLKTMLSAYPNKVCYLDEAPRSNTKVATHYKYKNQYLNGKCAVKDCLLLSKANVLIRTSSNLSLVSTYYNPSLRVIELNSRL